MKYIQNNGRYALAFEITKGSRNIKLVLDRRRVYMDTGNIATTGITAVEEDDYEKLCEFKRFNKLMEAGELELTDISKVDTAETKVKELEEANKKLEAELKKAKKDDSKELDKQLKDKDKEISDLKAQLEALTKTKKAKASAKKDEAEGF